LPIVGCEARRQVGEARRAWYNCSRILG